MYYLGINYYGHNTSCAIFKGNKLIFAVEEERLSRKKNDTNFPLKSILLCLKKCKIDLKDIKEIGAATIPNRLLEEKYLKYTFDNFPKVNDYFFDQKSLKNILFLNNAEKIIREKLNFDGKITFHNHHLCHMLSSYYLSGLRDAVSVSIDGVGEIESSAISLIKNGKVKILDSTNFPNSLGMLYSAITYFLGYRTNNSEGTVMALAALGNSKNKVKGQSKTYKEFFNEIVQIKKNGTHEINKDWFNYPFSREGWVSKKFISVFGKPRKKNEKLNQNFKNVAAALQQRFEDAYIAYLKRAHKISKMKNLTLSGGCALNCKANGLIEKKINFKKIYIQPAAGDNGLSIGAGFLSYLKNIKKPKKNKYYEHTYFGPEFSNRENKRTLKKTNLKFEYHKDICKVTAALLNQKKIIGWFQGKMEFGPRALGNRSILSSPFPEDQKHRINSKVKHREYFRPFAPAVLEEKKDHYFNLKSDSPFMLYATTANRITKLKAKAILHYDNSARVQTVKKNINKKFYNLIKEFNKLTKVPILLNTSFNDKGEPIVCTPQDAINTFLKTNIDYLVIENYLIKK